MWRSRAHIPAASASRPARAWLKAAAVHKVELHRMPGPHGGGGTAGVGTAAAKLPEAWASLNTELFPASEGFKPVVFSYQSNSTGRIVGQAERGELEVEPTGLGKLWVLALARELKELGIDTLNGYQIPAGTNWLTRYLGEIPECKVVVAMLSKTYFRSEACLDELRAAIEQKKPVIPIFLEGVNTEGHFLGESKQQIVDANTIRIKVLSKNCVPPPGQGFFPGGGAAHFKRNAKQLAAAITNLMSAPSGAAIDATAIAAAAAPGPRVFWDANDAAQEPEGGAAGTQAAIDLKPDGGLVGASSKAMPVNSVGSSGDGGGGPGPKPPHTVSSSQRAQKSTVPVPAYLANVNTHVATYTPGNTFDVIITYCTKSCNREGLHQTCAIANALEAQNITSFHGRMVKGGDNWQAVWFDAMEQAKVAIVLYSTPYFKSKACRDELVAIAQHEMLPDRTIPLFVEDVVGKMRGTFFGASRLQKQHAALVRRKIVGNCIPPPEEGLFHENWDKNTARLIDRVKELLEDYEDEVSTGGVAALHDSNMAVLQLEDTGGGAPARPPAHSVEAQQRRLKSEDMAPGSAWAAPAATRPISISGSISNRSLAGKTPVAEPEATMKPATAAAEQRQPTTSASKRNGDDSPGESEGCYNETNCCTLTCNGLESICDPICGGDGCMDWFCFYLWCCGPWCQHVFWKNACICAHIVICCNVCKEDWWQRDSCSGKETAGSCSQRCDNDECFTRSCVFSSICALCVLGAVIALLVAGPFLEEPPTSAPTPYPTSHPDDTYTPPHLIRS